MAKMPVAGMQYFHKLVSILSLLLLGTNLQIIGEIPKLLFIFLLINVFHYGCCSAFSLRMASLHVAATKRADLSHEKPASQKICIPRTPHPRTSHLRTSYLRTSYLRTSILIYGRHIRCNGSPDDLYLRNGTVVAHRQSFAHMFLEQHAARQHHGLHADGQHHALRHVLLDG